MFQIFKVSMNVRIISIGITVSLFTVISFFYQARLIVGQRALLSYFEQTKGVFDQVAALKALDTLESNEKAN